jgi:uncharacterized protein YcbX
MPDTNIGRVAALWRYPVQSLRGERVEALNVGPDMSIGDRGYGIFDPEAGHIAVSARGKKRWRPLVTWSARYLAEPAADKPLPPVEITFEDGTTLRSDAPNVDATLAARLGWDAKLVQVATSVPAYKHAAIHALTSATLATLQRLYPVGRFEMPRFRPNLFIETEAGDGFVESGWLGQQISVGGTRLRIDENTVRCVMTTLPQGDLPQDAGILATVTEANKQHAGVYCGVTQAGTMRLGDPVVLHAA